MKSADREPEITVVDVHAAVVVTFYAAQSIRVSKISVNGTNRTDTYFISVERSLAQRLSLRLTFERVYYSSLLILRRKIERKDDRGRKSRRFHGYRSSYLPRNTHEIIMLLRLCVF